MGLQVLQSLRLVPKNALGSKNATGRISREQTSKRDSRCLGQTTRMHARQKKHGALEQLRPTIKGHEPFWANTVTG
jgi:hypothetical protein